MTLSRLRSLIEQGMPTSSKGREEVAEICSKLIAEGPERSSVKLVRDTPNACRQRVLSGAINGELTADLVADIEKMVGYENLSVVPDVGIGTEEDRDTTQ